MAKKSKPEERLSVGLYVRDDNATILNLAKCLRLWDMSFRTIQRDELPSLKPGDVDVVLIHGGWYRIDSEEDAAKALRDFVDAGGGCIGVCCGAFNIGWLGLIEMEHLHIVRMTSWARITARAVRHPILKGVRERNQSGKGLSSLITIVYFNGPFMIPAKPSTTVVASYDQEGHLGAVLADSFGEGRVVAFGPHPEKELIEDSLTNGGALPRASLMLHNALYWTARRPVPKRTWEWARFDFEGGRGRRIDV